MKKLINLARIQKNSEGIRTKEISRKEMKNSTAGSLESECCQMFCKVSGDSIGELLFFIYEEADG
jgi:hypothetical protein